MLFSNQFWFNFEIKNKIFYYFTLISIILFAKSLNAESIVVDDSSSKLNDMNLSSSDSNSSNSNQQEPSDEERRQLYIIEFYSFPFIFVMGTVCNFLTFLVMRRKKMRHQSTYFYMAVLAITDELVLLIGCLNFWIYILSGNNVTLLSNISCKIASLLLYGTFHFGVWIVVIMTVERFIAVAMPLQANRLCTVKRAKLATLLLALIIFAINSHFLFSHSLVTGGCAINDKFIFFINKIWPWIDASIYSYIPLSLLIIFNILIVHNLIKASKNIEKLNTNLKRKSANNINYKIIKNSKQNSTENNSSSISNSNNISKSTNLLTNRNSECQLQTFSNRRNKRFSFYLFSFICMCCCCCLNKNKNNKNKNLQIKDKINDLNGKNNNNNKNTNDQLKKYSNSKYKLFKFKQIEQTNSLIVTQDTNKYHQNTPVTSIYNNNQNLNVSKNLPKNTSTNSLNVSSPKNVNSQSQSQSNSSTSASKRLTIMLLVVSITFFITSTPIVTLQTIEMAGLTSSNMSKLRGIFLLLQYLNHSINFFLYAVTGKTFRREFFALFKPSKKKIINTYEVSNFSTVGYSTVTKVMNDRKRVVKDYNNKDDISSVKSTKKESSITKTDQSKPSVIVKLNAPNTVDKCSEDNYNDEDKVFINQNIQDYINNNVNATKIYEAIKTENLNVTEV